MRKGGLHRQSQRHINEKYKDIRVQSHQEYLYVSGIIRQPQYRAIVRKLNLRVLASGNHAGEDRRAVRDAVHVDAERNMASNKNDAAIVKPVPRVPNDIHSITWTELYRIRLETTRHPGDEEGFGGLESEGRRHGAEPVRE